MNVLLENYLDFWRANLNENDNNCVYIDVPFCEKICSYCIYNSSIFSLEKMDKYMCYLKKWIDAYNWVYSDIVPKQIYFGGGTASLLSSSQISEIAESINQFDYIAHKSFEGHPDSLSTEKIRLLGKYGFEYFSVGIQSFNRNTIECVNRKYVSKRRLKEIIEQIHMVGAIVSVDLIAFLDGYSDESIDLFDEDLAIMTEYCKPDIICIHPSYKLIRDCSNEKKIEILRKLTSKVYECSQNKLYCLNEEFAWYYSNIDVDEAIIKWGRAAHNLYKFDSLTEVQKKCKYDCNYSLSKPHHSVFAMGGYDNRVLHSHLGKDNHWLISKGNEEVLIEKI